MGNVEVLGCNPKDDVRCTGGCSESVESIDVFVVEPPQTNRLVEKTFKEFGDPATSAISDDESELDKDRSYQKLSSAEKRLRDFRARSSPRAFGNQTPEPTPRSARERSRGRPSANNTDGAPHAASGPTVPQRIAPRKNLLQAGADQDMDSGEPWGAVTSIDDVVASDDLATRQEPGVELKSALPPTSIGNVGESGLQPEFPECRSEHESSRTLPIGNNVSEPSTQLGFPESRSEHESSRTLPIGNNVSEPSTQLGFPESRSEHEPSRTLATVNNVCEASPQPGFLESRPEQEPSRTLATVSNAGEPVVQLGFPESRSEHETSRTLAAVNNVEASSRQRGLPESQDEVEPSRTLTSIDNYESTIRAY